VRSTGGRATLQQVSNTHSSSQSAAKKLKLTPRESSTSTLIRTSVVAPEPPNCFEDDTKIKFPFEPQIFYSKKSKSTKI